MSRCKKVLQLITLSVLICSFLACGRSDVKPDQGMAPIHFQSATELTTAIRNGKRTSVELLDLYVDRIQRYDGDINAVVALDVDAARARAAEADQALADGQDWGPLHGLPMTVKDVFEVAGMPATSGAPQLGDYIPESNAIAVQRLVDSGAIVFGKTNVPYFAADFQTYNEIYGTTNNPWDLSRTPGGSSGGAAAALAAGFTPLELGSDIGGSVRNPAHYTGVFGHQPTFGLVPRHGHIPPPPGQVPPRMMPEFPLFVIGPLGRSADDLELVLEVLTTTGSGEESAGMTELLPPRRQQFKDYRVAVWLTDPYPSAEIDAEVLETLQAAVEKLRDAGLQLDEGARPNASLMENLRIWRLIFSGLMAEKLPDERLVATQMEQQATA